MQLEAQRSSCAKKQIVNFPISTLPQKCQIHYFTEKCSKWRFSAADIHILIIYIPIIRRADLCSKNKRDAENHQFGNDEIFQNTPHKEKEAQDQLKAE